MLSLKTIQSAGGCEECIYLPECGGLPGLDFFWGCFSKCAATCSSDGYDWTCPCKDREFAHRMQAVGGLVPPSIGPLRVPRPDALPLYIPTIQHGRGAATPLSWSPVAVPLGRVMTRHSGRLYGRATAGAEALRAQFRLAEGTRILLLSAGYDRHLESYWHHRKLHNAAVQLASLDLLAASTPNFSFFSNAPRTDVIFNRRRTLMVADEWSRAGIDTLLHINALTEHDWMVWAELLAERPHIHYVVKEFQTGLGDRAPGIAAIQNLCRLQDRLGRDIHPVIVGGAQYIGLISRHFHNITLVDSQPFMKTIKRHAFFMDSNGKLRLTNHPAARGEALEALLLANIKVYQEWVQAQVEAKLGPDDRIRSRIRTSRGKRSSTLRPELQHAFCFPPNIA